MAGGLNVEGVQADKDRRGEAPGPRLSRTAGQALRPANPTIVVGRRLQSPFLFAQSQAIPSEQHVINWRHNNCPF